MKKSKKGKVYLVGGGPGDPGLITVKGLRLVQIADVVVYDFLAPLDVLKEVKTGAELICVGKKDGLHLQEQEAINQILLLKSRQHKVVVRLKGGDPFLFSRGIEEWQFLTKKGIPVEVVPGVTSAIAAPESFGIPLTMKNKITSVGIVSGRRVDPNAAIEAPQCGTLVYLMAVANIAKVVQALRKAGRPAQEPCAFVERCTRPGARVLYSTLGKVEKAVQRHHIKPPAIFIVGKVVASARLGGGRRKGVKNKLTT